MSNYLQQATIYGSAAARYVQLELSHNFMRVMNQFTETARTQFDAYNPAVITAFNGVKGKVYQLPYGRTSADALSWIQSHPGQTAFIVVGGTVFFVPSLATVPALAALGFTGAGPVAGEFLANLFCFFPPEFTLSVYAKIPDGCYVMEADEWLRFSCSWIPGNHWTCSCEQHLRDDAERCDGRVRCRCC